MKVARTQRRDKALEVAIKQCHYNEDCQITQNNYTRMLQYTRHIKRPRMIIHDTMVNQIKVLKAMQSIPVTRDRRTDSYIFNNTEERVIDICDLSR